MSDKVLLNEGGYIMGLIISPTVGPLAGPTAGQWWDTQQVDLPSPGPVQTLFTPFKVSY